MTFAETLRAYVAAHPGTNYRQIAEGIGEDMKRVSARLNNMVHHQILRADSQRPRGYSIRRELVRRKRNDADARARYLAYQRDYYHAHKGTAAKGIIAATVEDYEAQGGRIDVLPGYRYVPAPQTPVGDIAECLAA